MTTATAASGSAAPTTTSAPTPIRGGNDNVARKIENLSAAAGRRIVEPDVEVTGHIGEGQLIPDHLLTIAGLDLDLTPEQRITLAREEIASITQAGIRFEAVLEAGFAAHVALAEDLSDPRITFILHELGEETRHQRLFQRLLGQLAPTAKQPLPFRLFRIGCRIVIDATINNKAFFYTLVLAGEEIPDLFQKIASEDPTTDEFIRAVNKYHRMEEARHLSFARAVMPEIWAQASRLDKTLVRHVAPLLIRFMFDSMVHPGVYETVGLPAFPTWRAANRTPERRNMRHTATRPILKVLQEAGALSSTATAGWRSLTGMRRNGELLGAAAG
jgi:hypothetical protein